MFSFAFTSSLNNDNRKVYIGQSFESFCEYAHIRPDYEGEVNEYYKDYIGSFKRTIYNGEDVSCTFINDTLECLLLNEIFFTEGKLYEALLQHKTFVDFFIKKDDDIEELLNNGIKRYYDGYVTTKIEIVKRENDDYLLSVDVYSDKYQVEFQKIIKSYRK
ncbi:MAG: hypothetical protein GY827_08125 [Cytophagales bacterium]|nr:hypothetical protein [Cytophagales bacterium]